MNIRNAIIAAGMVLSASISGATHPAPNPAAQKCKGHGFWLIPKPNSTNRFYLSHKPMEDHVCHQFQVVVEAEFVGQGMSSQSGSKIDPAAKLFQGKLYSLEAREQSGPDTQPVLASYTKVGEELPANLWLDNFENPAVGKLLVKSCSIRIVDTITDKPAQLKPTADGKFRGYLWGTPDALFLANQIDIKGGGALSSDVNQVLRIKAVGDTSELKAKLPGKGGVKVVINGPKQQLKEDANITLIFQDGKQIKAQVEKSSVQKPVLAVPPNY
jgi:hypothetical protein